MKRNTRGGLRELETAVETLDSFHSKFFPLKSSSRVSLTLQKHAKYFLPSLHSLSRKIHNYFDLRSGGGGGGKSFILREYLFFNQLCTTFKAHLDIPLGKFKFELI